MSAPGLDTVLVELATADACRAYNGIKTGGLIRDCGKGEARPRLVTLVCEHEHFYDVALCAAHRKNVSAAPLGCPLCQHRCRHAICEGAS